ncbi:hypothetical protein [Nitratireductor aquimarinus]
MIEKVGLAPGLFCFQTGIMRDSALRQPHPELLHQSVLMLKQKRLA